MPKKVCMERFKTFILGLSFQERRKKQYQKRRKELNELRNLSTEELEIEYILLKAKYEYKKKLIDAMFGHTYYYDADRYKRKVYGLHGTAC